MDKLTIKQISEATGIPNHTLRFWEKEFCGILVPSRTKGGQRRYSLQHIEIIEKIKSLKEEGTSLNQIKLKLVQSVDGCTDMNTLDLLADRIASIVRTEVYNYFRSSPGDMPQKQDRTERNQQQ